MKRNKLIAKIFSLVIAAAFAAYMPFVCTAKAASKGTLTVTGGTLTQAQVDGYDNIVVSGSVTLDNVTFSAATGSALKVSGTATITVLGTCSLTGADGGAGIEVPKGSVLTLTGTGTLKAVGNGGSENKNDKNIGGAGIGGSRLSPSSGTINITSLAHLTAIGYGRYASGIGSCSQNNDGGITVTNSVIDLAQGAFAQQHITSSYGKSEPEGGPAIGGGSANGIAGKVTVSGSTVKAVGGSKSAAIGAGFWGDKAEIVIASSTVNAVGGCTASAIGLARVDGSYASHTGSVSITDSSVTAQGGDYGAGIGSGYNIASAKGSALGTVTVAISGGTINAVGGDGGAGIGGGYKGHNVNITIKNGAKVTAVGGVLGETFDKGKVASETAGASAIGTGANGSSSFSGGTISIDSTCSINAASNGDKWAIDYENCDVSGVSANLLQARYERTYGIITRAPSDETGTLLDASKANEVSVGGTVVTLPKGYYCAAASIGVLKTAVISPSYTPVYSSYLTKLNGQPQISTANADFTGGTGVVSDDYCAFRAAAVPAAYTVNFVDYNGAAISSANYLYGAAVNVPASPSRAADASNTYAFLGWSTDGSTVLSSIPAVTGNATYIAVYKASAVVVIDDNTTPKSDKPGSSTPAGTVVINDNNTPTGSATDDGTVTILDDDVPLSGTPATGDNTVSFAAALIFISAACAAILAVSVKKSRETM